LNPDRQTDAYRLTRSQPRSLLPMARSSSTISQSTLAIKKEADCSNVPRPDARSAPTFQPAFQARRSCPEAMTEALEMQAATIKQ